MSSQWCTHPTAHVGKVKIGSKPNHPKGDRRLHDDLNMFVEKSYGSTDQTGACRKEHRFCRTCYEKESKNFDDEKLSQRQSEHDVGENMDLNDEISTIQANKKLESNQSLDRGNPYGKSYA